MPSDQHGNCERCSTSFSLFKRKKLCNLCKQEFCSSCLIRVTPYSSRICLICYKIDSNETSYDDLMKLKIKHLRLYILSKNICIQSIKEKNELVDLIVRNRHLSNRINSSNGNQQQQQQQPPPQQNSNTFNDTFNNFMNNVQDFVNFNVNNAQRQSPNTAAASSPSSSSSTSSSSNRNNNNGSSSSSSFTSNLFGFMNNLPNEINKTFTNTATFGNRNSNTYSSFDNLFNLNPNNVNSNRTNENQSNKRPATSVNRAQPDTMRPSSTPPQPQPAQPTRQSNNISSQSTLNNNNNNAQQENSTDNVKRRASISDLNNEQDIDQLTIKQMKQILASNFVEYSGCFERKELVERVKLLYNSHKENSSKLNTNVLSSDNASANENDLCKICMDSLIDCVLIECGHMVSCTKCGKRLAECPMCRQNVIRVLRVFKS